MVSSPRTVERREEDEGRLSPRTLVVASAASASAAAVTSQLWIAGTWIAAALTPVLVALLSEALHRPTRRIARWTTERPAREGAGAQPARASARGLPAGARSAPAPGGLPGEPAPVRLYRQPQARRPRRRLALGAVVATALIAFVVAIAAITAGDLLAGGSIGKGAAKTTLFRGGTSDSSSDERDGTQPQEREQSTESQPETTPPAETTPEPPPTAETPPAGEPAPAQQPAPDSGAPAPVPETPAVP
jgi:hypothetical protein